MRSIGGMRRIQVVIDENRLRILKEQWLPVAAFVALSLPLVFIESTPSQPASYNEVPTASTPAPQPAPVSTPAPLPQAAAKPQAAARLQPVVQHKNPRRILISIPDRKLAVLENGKVRKVYPVAVGAEVSPSPAGAFHIAHKIVAPSYSHKGKVIAAGKQNPLGSRWMGLDLSHYGIHGTNMPESIGHAASHGCIRMGKHDVEELFAMASVGDVVEIHDERTEEIAQIFATRALAQPAASKPEKTNEVAQAEQLIRDGE